ncbi:hypothetical protein [Dactylosporangium vinaceum]|uniref:hypothetical protein n=1 Tax=Dactylosporangium vinaceum TaxID=53362 RepID=UPI003CCED7C5
MRTANLGGVVRTASERDVEVVAGTRTLPVVSGLRDLLPGGGLRRGATVAVYTSSVMLALLAAASRAGSWCAVVGLPGLSPIAAAEMGIALERLALVPHPGAEWTTIVAALLDGFDIVVAAAPKNIAPAVAGRLAARARQRGSVLVPAGAWAGADLTLAPVRGAWGGLGAGRGRLRHRELTVQARGRGAASAAREVTLELPAITGVLPPIQVPSTQAPPICGPSTQAPPLHGLSIQGPATPTPTPAAHGPAGAGHRSGAQEQATHENRSEETPKPLRKVG